MAAVLSGCGGIEATLNQPEFSSSASIAPYDTTRHQRSVHVFDAIDLGPEISAKKMTPRADNLLVLVDNGGDMDEPYRGVPRRDYASEIVRRLNETLPGDIAPRAVTRTSDDDLVDAIDELADEVSAMRGPTALIIVTRWEHIDEPVAEAIARLRQHNRHGSGLTIGTNVKDWRGNADGDLCVYSIGVGNWMSRTRYDGGDECGFSSAADKIAQPRDMAHFVKRALYNLPADNDGDGIHDYRDNCPNTPPDRLVDFEGCLLFGGEEQ